MKDEGWSIALYCLSLSGLPCSHGWSPSWDQLIQYFGQDFDITGDREPFARLVCERCGGRGASVIVLPKDHIDFRASGGHANQPDAMTVEQSLEAYRAFMADFRGKGFKTNAELNAQSRARLKAERRAAIIGAAEFIGPPNPRSPKASQRRERK